MTTTTAGAGGSRRSHETVERLYSATTALIAEVGWDNTSSRRVADRAGVSLGVVHYHFSSIDELRRRAAVALIERFFVDATAIALEGPTTGAVPTAAEAIDRLFGALAAGDPRRPELNVLYQSLVAAVRDDGLSTELAAMIADYRVFVAEVLTQTGVENARSTAFAIVAAVDGFLLQRALDPDLDPHPIADALTRLASPGQRGEANADG